MKLSVCIPVYNFDVRELVFEVKKQILSTHSDAEIILIDDASNSYFIEINAELSGHVTQFIKLDQNIGRARIRNLFTEYARGEFLLFLDCDVKIDSPDFILNYLNIQKRHPETDVFYGNFKVDNRYKNTFRNKYSEKREIFSEKESDDFNLLKTVNVMLRKSLFTACQFDEKLADYGYEDFLFSKVLQAKGARFLAFQNPVIHVDDSSAQEFLDKTDTAIDSLIKLSNDLVNAKFIQDVKLYKTAITIKNLRMQKLFMFFFDQFGKRIIANLHSAKPRMIFFDFYKLKKLLERL